MFLKIGHRGAAGYEPENTLRSFRKALELNVDMVEMDVYLCRSGELVVIHDDRVDRTTDGTGYVMDKTFDELKTLDAGMGERIPMLDEVLDLVDRGAKVNIELKGVKTAKPVSTLIERYVRERNWAYDDFLVSSFDHYELLRFKGLSPDVKTGAVIAGIPIGYAGFAGRIGVYSIHLSMEFINREFVDDAHERGMKVFVWTVNAPDDIVRVKSLGVDGIFSDYPDRLSE